MNIYMIFVDQFDSWSRKKANLIKAFSPCLCCIGHDLVYYFPGEGFICAAQSFLPDMKTWEFSNNRSSLSLRDDVYLFGQQTVVRCNSRSKEEAPGLSSSIFNTL